MSKREENASDDEFHDAVSTTTKNSEEFIGEQCSKENYCGLSDDVETHDPDYQESDTIDEEGLKEEEEFISEEQKLKNKEEADKLKLEGNELFKHEKYKESVEIYTKALMLCPLIYSKDRAIFYANRAAAKINLGSKEGAIEDCTKALELNPDYVRALIRRARLYEDTDKMDEALEDYKKIVERDPSNRDANEALIRLPPMINERNERLKAEMMVKLKDLGNMILKPFGLSTANFQVNQDPSTGSYSINLNNQNPSETNTK